MEYEIEDQTRLFDDSTNPSLKRRQRTPARETPRRDRRKLQKAELIPEEEEQVAQVADRVGFEPTVGLHPRRFSRPLP